MTAGWRLMIENSVQHPARLKTISSSSLFSCLQPGLDWTRLFMSLTAGAGTRCMSLLPTSPNHRPMGLGGGNMKTQ